VIEGKHHILKNVFLNFDTYRESLEIGNQIVTRRSVLVRIHDATNEGVHPFVSGRHTADVVTDRACLILHVLSSCWNNNTRFKIYLMHPQNTYRFLRGESLNKSDLLWTKYVFFFT